MGFATQAREHRQYTDKMLTGGLRPAKKHSETHGSKEDKTNVKHTHQRAGLGNCLLFKYSSHKTSHSLQKGTVASYDTIDASQSLTRHIFYALFQIAFTIYITSVTTWDQC